MQPGYLASQPSLRCVTNALHYVPSVLNIYRGLSVLGWILTDLASDIRIPLRVWSALGVPFDGFRILSAPISEYMGFLSFRVSTVLLNKVLSFSTGRKSRLPLREANVSYKTIP